jgi:hypothetical protein
MEKQIVEITAEEVIRDFDKLYALIDRCTKSKEFIKILNYGKFFEDNNKYYPMILEALEKMEELEVGIIIDDKDKFIPPPPAVVVEKMPGLNFDRSKITAERGKN